LLSAQQMMARRGEPLDSPSAAETELWTDALRLDSSYP